MLLSILFHSPRLHFLRQAGAAQVCSCALVLSGAVTIQLYVNAHCPFSLLLLLSMETDIRPIKMQGDHPVSKP